MLLLGCVLAPFAPLQAVTYPLKPGSDLLGIPTTTTVLEGQSMGDIGRLFNMGVYEMIEANPQIDPWVPPAHATLIIPSRYVLPPGPRRGIVLNLAEMRLYFYHPDGLFVSTYPVGIGRKKWPTPLAETKVVAKQKDPAWYPPASIKMEHAQRGDILPLVVPAGPNNPLGPYAIRTGLSSILIHGTNKPTGIGLRGSHGCVRLFNQDISDLYQHVDIDTPVRIIHAPFKLGFEEGQWYLESHEPLNEPRFADSHSEAALRRELLKKGLNQEKVDWIQLLHIMRRNTGMPEPF